MKIRNLVTESALVIAIVSCALSLALVSCAPAAASGREQMKGTAQSAGIAHDLITEGVIDSEWFTESEDPNGQSFYF